MHFPTALVSSVLLLSGLVSSQITITRTVTIDPIEVTEPTRKPTTKKSSTSSTIKTLTSSSVPAVTKTIYVTITTGKPPPSTTKKPNTTAPAPTQGPDVNSSKLCPVPEYYNCYESRSKDDKGRNACTQCQKGLYCKSWSEYYSQCLPKTDSDDW